MLDIIQIDNPFGAPVYYKNIVTSTMDEARLLLSGKTGTVITAGKQSAGRGRSGRPWQMNSGENLSFTIMLRYPSIEEIPPVLTLRAGLAVALAIEDVTAELILELHNTRHTPVLPFSGRVLVKWPNDVMLLDRDGRGRKAAGILTEAENGNVYIGIGVNVAQSSFPPELSEKACSIGQMAYNYNNIMTEQFRGKPLALILEKRFTLLEKILYRLFEEINNAVDKSLWQKRLNERLYMKGCKVRFVCGLPEEQISGQVSAVEGILLGIGENGEIIIAEDSGKTGSYITGELSKIPI